MDINMYETQADSINVDDIATNSNNRIVLHRLQKNEANEYTNSLYIQNEHDGEYCDYVPEGADDMGWLGYFVGKNQYLEVLSILTFVPTSGASVRDVIVPFLRGVNHNKSIQEINFSGVDLLGGEVFTMLGSFFRDNHNLTKIIITDCDDLGDEWGRLFALALGSSTNKSLKKVDLQDNDISEEVMVDIVTALSVYPHLEQLDLNGNRLGENGCVALATLLQSSAKELQYLYLSNNEVIDEGIEALVPALANCNRLEYLHLSRNPSITTLGWQSLASVLEFPSSNLKGISITENNVDDEAVTAFANALTSNNMLHTLNMILNPSITTIGWQSFSKTPCNTSTTDGSPSKKFFLTLQVSMQLFYQITHFITWAAIFAMKQLVLYLS